MPDPRLLRAPRSKRASRVRQTCSAPRSRPGSAPAGVRLRPALIYHRRPPSLVPPTSTAERPVRCCGPPSPSRDARLAVMHIVSNGARLQSSSLTHQPRHQRKASLQPRRLPQTVGELRASGQRSSTEVKEEMGGTLARPARGRRRLTRDHRLRPTTPHLERAIVAGTT